MSNVHTFNGSNKVQLLIPCADNGDVNTSWVNPFSDGEGAERAVFLISVGTVGAQLDMTLYQAQDASGTGRKIITDAAITQVSSANDEKVATIEIGPGALDDPNGFKYVRAEVVVAGSATEEYTVLLIKHRLRYPGIGWSGVGAQHSTYDEAVTVLG
jgi:hypothetical protein